MQTKLANEGLVAGRYRLVRELGRGSSARVFLAEDTARAGMQRAIKVVPEAWAHRLQWELGWLAKLRHPAVASVDELLWVEPEVGASFEIPGGSAALVCEHVPGESAGEAVLRHAQPSARLRFVLAVGEAAASALAAIHAAGAIHGDVKPDNIVVDAQLRTCKIVDLGLAAAFGATDQAAGTPAYMAPEVWSGRRTARSDLYALGATLEHLLRGAPPQPSTEDGARQGAVLRRALQPRAPLPAWVPAELQRLLVRLQAQDPDARPAAAREVAARLAALGEGSGEAGRALLEREPTPEERALALEALPFQGQAAALQRLAAALARPGLVVVHGAPGAGRTRLVQEAVRRAQLASVEGERTCPTYLAVPQLPTKAPSRPTILHSLREGPAAIAGATALSRACGIEGQWLCVVLELDEPVADTDVEQVEVPPLGEAEARGLVEQACGRRLPEEAVRAALAAGGGLAGRTCRLLAEGMRQDADLARAGTWRRLGRALECRAEAPPEAAELLAWATLAGGELDGHIARALLRSDAALACAVTALRGAGLGAVDASGRLAVRGDVVERRWRALSYEQRRQWGQALAQQPLAADAKGFALLAAGESNAAVKALEEATQAAMSRGEPEQAAQMLAVARGRFGEDDVPDTLRIAEAEALRAAGRYAEAQRRLRGAASLPARILAAELARLQGRAEEGLRQLRAALQDAVSLPAGARARIAAEMARGSLDAGLEKTLHDELALALQADEPAVRARAHEVEALMCLRDGALERAERAAEAACQASAHASLRIQARAHGVAANVALALGRTQAAAQRFAEAHGLAARAGERHAAASFMVNLGLGRLHMGELGVALKALGEGARMLAQLARDADVARALLNLAQVRALIGDDDAARLAATHARAAGERAGDVSAVAFARLVEAEVMLRQGDPDAAWACVEPVQARVAELVTSHRVVAEARLAQLAARVGRGDMARAWLERCRSTAELADSDDAGLEHAVAGVHVALAADDAAAASEPAERANVLAQRVGQLEGQLRACQALVLAAQARGDGERAQAGLAEMRALLDRMAASLPPDARARLRDVPAYRRALQSAPEAARPAQHEADARWRLLASLAKRLAAEHRLGRLYERIVDAAVELTGAERGFLLLRDASGKARVRAARGLNGRTLQRDDLTLSRSVALQVLGGGRALSTMDAMQDERLDAAASVHALALRSVLAVPLRMGDDVAGALYLDDRLRPFAFGEAELELVAELAELAALAIESARRLQAQRRSARRLTVMRARLQRTVETQALQLQAARRADPEHGAKLPGLVGESEAMRAVAERVRRVARSEIPVLIVGESGTGKELVARAIHAQSPRADRPLISENCSAIPETLLESTLFGHVRGAFTGAERRRVGLFEAADGGTLFLDEIGEMSHPMQTRLLRALQEGEIRPVGSERSRRVDVRVLAATHRDLERMVREGHFREDLYYRLAVVHVRLPPLRERSEDIPRLIEHFLTKHAEGRVPRVEPGALKAFARHAWPGNVRELENEMRRCLLLADDVIRLEHLSPQLGEPAASGAGASELDLKGQVDALQRRLVRAALERAEGNQSKAARLLGVSRYGLQKMLRRLEV